MLKLMWSSWGESPASLARRVSREKSEAPRPQQRLMLYHAPELQDNEADAASRPARKRLRRAVIEDDDDAALAVASKPAAAETAAPQQPTAAESELEDKDATMTDAPAATTKGAAAAPTAAAGTPAKSAAPAEVGHIWRGESTECCV